MSRPGFFSHPKFRRLAHSLGGDEAKALGHLEFLWSVGYENGEEEIGDFTDVELAAKWSGEPGALTKALLTCGGEGRAGLIDRIGTSDRYQIHDLFDHCPEYVKRRAKRESDRRKSGKSLSDIRRESAAKRWDARQSEANNMQSDANGQPFASHEVANVSTPAPAPAPNSIPPRNGSADPSEDNGAPGTPSFKEALRMVDKWGSAPSPVGRGYPTNPTSGEPQKIAECLRILADEPKIAFGANLVSRHLMVPKAVENLMNKRKEFKGIGWIITCITGEISEMARAGAERAPATQLPRRSDPPNSWSRGADHGRALKLEENPKPYIPPTKRSPALDALPKRTGGTNGQL